MFGKKGKLNPCYIAPFDTLKKIGKVAYQLTLPSKLSMFLDVIYVSMIKRYVPDSIHVLTLKIVQVNQDLSY